MVTVSVSNSALDWGFLLFCKVLEFYKDIQAHVLWPNRTKTSKDYADLASSTLWKNLQSDLQTKSNKIEVHQARAFNGHIDRQPKFQG